MKVVDIPDPVTVKLTKLRDSGIVEEEETVTFTAFLTYALDSYAELAKGPAQVRQYDRIMKVVESVNGAKTIQFESKDYDVVKAAVEAKQWPSGKIARKYLPFFEAVEKAEEIETPTGK